LGGAIRLRINEHSIYDDELRQGGCESLALTTNEEFVWEYDVFIVHASEDKLDVAEPLKEALESANLRVWLDKYAMQYGDRVQQSIERGLRMSDYVVVIVSPEFLRPDRYWTETELALSFLAEKARERTVILTVLHNTTIDQLKEANPELGERFAFSTDSGPGRDIDALAEAIIRRVNPVLAEARSLKLKAEARAWRDRVGTSASGIESGADVSTRVAALRDLAVLADESLGNRRQACIDVLCAFIRRASTERADREVQHEALRVVREHLAVDAPPATAWHSMHLDFTRAVFDEINLMNIAVRGGMIDFYDATFDGSYFNFYKLEIDSPLDHQGVYFGAATVKHGRMYFDLATREHGALDFSGLTMVEGDVQFWRNDFRNGLGTRDGHPFLVLDHDPGDQAVRIGADGVPHLHPNPYA
jgi:TIR domain